MGYPLGQERRRAQARPPWPAEDLDGGGRPAEWLRVKSKAAREPRARRRLDRGVAMRSAGALGRAPDGALAGARRARAGPCRTLWVVKGQTGASTQTYESAARKKRRAKARARQEERWAEQAGPVLLRLGGYEYYVTEKGVDALKRARELLLRAIDGDIAPGVTKSAE